jgi:hypothetical protein
MKNSNLSSLLKNKPEAYYWMGFLMADGHFEEKRLFLVLSSKDKEHVQSFAKFVNSETEPYKTRNAFGVRFMDSIVVPKLRKKFDIQTNKTQIPCSFNIDNTDLFIAFLIGFIDGDGCICKNQKRPDSHIKIKCHSSWLSNFDLWSKRLSELTGIEVSSPKLNKQGYAVWNITNTIVLRYLKRKSLSLPVLHRKWNRINENFVSRQEKGKERVEKVQSFLVEGLKKTEIAKRLAISKSAVSQIIKRHSL